jgi:hypothetical protein
VIQASIGQDRANNWVCNKVTQVSYFQRFSQRENHATNNTLLILRRFYDESPFKLERVLSALIEAELGIGLQFEQQVSGSSSVPDALISQPAFNLFVETKRGATLDEDQIERHLDTIKELSGEKRGNHLLGLTQEAIPEEQDARLKVLSAQNGVIFSSTTFSQLLDELRSECELYERDLVAIVDDFEDYLSGEDLLETRNQKLPIIPCGTSFEENKRFGVYYEPAKRRTKSPYRFIGIYKNKSVLLLGEIGTVVVTEWSDNTLSLKTEFGEITDEKEALIRRVVDETDYYDLKEEQTRFYLFATLAETDIRKTSSGGIFGMRYLDLSKMDLAVPLNNETTVSELAEALRGKKFE